MGGEKPSFGQLYGLLVGSPPRGRGKAAAPVWRRWYARITPAWAGKSLLSMAAALSARDHPRVGGEKCRGSSAAHKPLGSPPRGRGKDLGPCGVGGTQGITPAWAGKSSVECCVKMVERDHPRVGGEKPVGFGAGPRPHGSPPRGRGKANPTGRNRTAFRITPAWAGKSSNRKSVEAMARDHPRVGGEKGHAYKKRQFGGGSPPRGRGKD